VRRGGFPVASGPISRFCRGDDHEPVHAEPADLHMVGHPGSAAPAAH